MIYKYKELSSNQKSLLLRDEYVRDGADDNTAKDSAANASDPDKILREVFGYEDETEVSI